MEETRHERYLRLAQSRQSRLLREIQILGNLSNRKNYNYTAQDVADLFEPLREELTRTQARFDKPDNNQPQDTVVWTASNIHNINGIINEGVRKTIIHKADGTYELRTYSAILDTEESQPISEQEAKEMSQL